MTEQNEQNSPQKGVNSVSAAPVEAAAPSVASTGRRFTLMHVVVLMNLLMLSGFGTFAVVMFQRLQQGDALGQINIVASDTAENTKTMTETGKISDLPDRNVTSSLDPEVAKEASVSLETARYYYQRSDYSKAYYVYHQLRESVTGGELKQQCLRDWLILRMALCLQFDQSPESASNHFTQALQSRSLYVRTMANYSLMLIQHENQQFLEARRRAYQVLGVMSAVKKYMPKTLEADCYFAAAESLTSHIQSLSNLDPQFPGQNWTRSRLHFDCEIDDQRQLAEMLMTGVEESGQAVLSPCVEYYPNRSVGSQWTGISLDAPLEQLFWRIASEADLVVSWDSQAQQLRRSGTTLYLPFVNRQYLLEVVAGGAGLVWHYDGQVGTIYDPVNYDDFQTCQKILCQEAISAWQQFLIRYRSDTRIANAHYALGQLYQISEDPATALGHYKLMYSQFNRDELAPYALLNASKIKSQLQDYTGAREDLNELLIHYPNFKVIGEALLYMAEASMNCGLFEEAAHIYERAYLMDITPEVRLSALFGRGQCAFECDDFEGCVQWLGQALEKSSDASDVRRGPAYLMLGRSFGKLGRYGEASAVLRMALGGTLAHEDYVDIIIELAESECERENYLRALTILEDVPDEELSQEDTCRVLLVKNNIYTLLDLTEMSISLLRRQIEFIADARLRARLSMELAYCYMLNGDLKVAQRELNDAMYDLPAGYDTQRAGYLMAQLAFMQDEDTKSERLCLQVLETQVADETLRSQVYELLGQIYTRRQAYDSAALAYAGLIGKESMQ